jgi:protocatechuate 3,4-dioxygenase alpha subunit
MSITTGSQTIGPYWHLLLEPEWSDLTRFGATGEKITLTGRVFDGSGAPVTDACIEIWQSSPTADENFQGFGRSATDSTGRFRFTTVKPGPVAGRGNSMQAPHLAITILARGILIAVHTRAYFEGETLNEHDPLLSMIEDPARRGTLIARQTEPGTWDMDIFLQGEKETVFLDI